MTTMKESGAGVRFAGLDWFLANFDALADQYPGEWIAILDDRVVAHAHSPGELGNTLRSLGIQRAFVTRTGEDAWRSAK